jgi:F0F1-type ATP synthase delta subunit
MKTSRTVVARTLAGRLSDPKLARETAAYLITERRVSELDSLIRDIEQYRADHNGVVELTAVSAHELDAKVISDIETRLKQAYPEAKDFIINQQLDASVVGGVRLELANQQLDLSVRNKLNTFKQLTTGGDK